MKRSRLLSRCTPKNSQLHPSPVSNQLYTLNYILYNRDIPTLYNQQPIQSTVIQQGNHKWFHSSILSTSYRQERAQQQRHSNSLQSTANTVNCNPARKSQMVPFVDSVNELSARASSFKELILPSSEGTAPVNKLSPQAGEIPCWLGFQIFLESYPSRSYRQD